MCQQSERHRGPHRASPEHHFSWIAGGHLLTHQLAHFLHIQHFRVLLCYNRIKKVNCVYPNNRGHTRPVPQENSSFGESATVFPHNCFSDLYSQTYLCAHNSQHTYFFNDRAWWLCSVTSGWPPHTHLNAIARVLRTDRGMNNCFYSL